MKKVINTTKAPAAIGAYSQGTTYNDLIFISGQLPINPETGKMSDKVEEQTHQSLKNVIEILKEAGSNTEKVLKCTIFIKNMNDFAVINSVYEKYFSNPFPARAVVEVARLPKDALIEIEAIAIK